jgi:transcriptional regulator with XRE-family HTH domain
MSISQRLVKIRKTYDCTQAEFAKMLDTNGQSIADVENDKKKIGITLLEKLHTKLSINLNWIVSGTGKMKIEYGEKEEIRFSVSEPPSDYQTRKILEVQEKLIQQYESEIERLKAKCGEKKAPAEKQTKP